MTKKQRIVVGLAIDLLDIKSNDNVNDTLPKAEVARDILIALLVSDKQ